MPRVIAFGAPNEAAPDKGAFNGWAMVSGTAPLARADIWEIGLLLFMALARSSLKRGDTTFGAFMLMQGRVLPNKT